MQTTIKEYAEKHGISASTARRRLEALRISGRATVRTIWEDPPTVCFQHQQAPAHRVNVYTIEGETK